MAQHRRLYLFLVTLFAVALTLARSNPQRAPEITGASGLEQFRSGWHVLDPITRGNLSIYPVVSGTKADTSAFLTLDEGVASGLVKIAERGQLESPLIRRRNPRRWLPEPAPVPQSGGASVNELVLVNESSRPLILLAGEVVSGGKQHRIIGADLLVPPKSEPIPLSVFCIEHGRWSAGGGGFASAEAIANPRIRKEAQVSRSQQKVWDGVAGAAMALSVHSPTGSYVDVLNSPAANRELEKAASEINVEYARELRDQLQGRGAVGVVVAINGELVWSDIFPSAELFDKYWPKLLRSYLLEAKGCAHEKKHVPSTKETEAFLRESRGHVTIDVEPQTYRRTQISTDDCQVVALEAPGKTEESCVLLHYNKMVRG